MRRPPAGADRHDMEKEERMTSIPQDPARVARGLGWFSIGLGLAEIAAPRRIARAIGVRDAGSRTAVRVIGLRELASGVGILSRDRPVGPVWTRVGGDLMDLALLSRALRSNPPRRNRVAAATAAVLGVTVLDLLTGRELSRTGNGALSAAPRREVEIRRAVTIDRPREEVYEFWRNFENLPRFMEHLVSVQVLDDRRSRWKARVPAGSTVEWDAEINDDRPNELITWRSLGSAGLPNTGTVRFLPSPQGGTEVRIELRFGVPGGRVAGVVAKVFKQAPQIQVARDLRRLKQLLELGEVVHSDASVATGPHPARPPARRIEVQTPNQAAREGARA
jgi:uncharacterized membrane protein